jgi:hypothetical protein
MQMDDKRDADKTTNDDNATTERESKTTETSERETRTGEKDAPADKVTIERAEQRETRE